MSFLLIVVVSVLLVLVAYILCRYQSSIIDQISDKAESNFWTVLAQRKDIEGYLQQIKSLEEHCVAQKRVVDEYYAQIKDLKQKLGVVPFERSAFELQIEDLASDLKERENTIRKLNRKAQKAESELIKSQKYHRNTKTYFKDRLEWSLDALQDARNLVTQLGNKIDWHLKTCNPFEKKEAESPKDGFQGELNKETK